jgi:hypothetical protein
MPCQNQCFEVKEWSARVYEHPQYGLMICPCTFPLASPTAHELEQIRTSIREVTVCRT